MIQFDFRSLPNGAWRPDALSSIFNPFHTQTTIALFTCTARTFASQFYGFQRFLI